MFCGLSRSYFKAYLDYSSEEELIVVFLVIWSVIWLGSDFFNDIFAKEFWGR